MPASSAIRASNNKVISTDAGLELILSSRTNLIKS